MAEIIRELSFPLSEYQARIDKVKTTMTQRGLDVLLVHSLPAICYLTGFQTLSIRSYSCFVLPVDGSPKIVTERDEQWNARLNSWVDNLFTYARGENPVQVTVEVLEGHRLHSSRIGVENASRYLTPLDYSKLLKSLSPAVLIDSSDIIPICMLIKSAREIEYIRQAAEITVHGMRAAIESAATGKTDNDVASAASQVLIASGSEYMSSNPIVCAGRNSGIPHGHYSRRKLCRGETILLEMGACVHRYSAPLMRTVTLGEPTDTVVAMASACKRALEDVISLMRPGIPFADAAFKGKAAITAAGSSMIFHGTYAYSVGLGFPGTSWADCPIEVRDNVPTVFQPGMVFHLPMSLRDAGKYGVAFSETVVITNQGCDVLTKIARELFLR